MKEGSGAPLVKIEGGASNTGWTTSADKNPACSFGATVNPDAVETGSRTDVGTPSWTAVLKAATSATGGRQPDSAPVDLNVFEKLNTLDAISKQ